MDTRRGNIESLIVNVLHGWSWNPNDIADKTVYIAVDGTRSGSASASIYRSDLKSAAIGTGNHAFEYLVPDSLLDGRLHTFALVPPTGEGDTPYCEIKLLCGTADPSFDGRLETVTRSHVNGWAFDRRNPQEHLNIAVFVEGHMIGSGLASQFRQDLLNAQVGEGDHGFTLRLKPGLIDNIEQHTLTVSVLSKGKQFEIGQRTIPSREDKLALSTSAIESVCKDVYFPTVTDDAVVMRRNEEEAAAHKTIARRATLFFHSSVKPDELGVVAHCSRTIRVAPNHASSDRLLVPLPWMINLLDADWEVGIDVVLGASLDFDSSVVAEEGKGQFREIVRLRKGHRLGPGRHSVTLYLLSRELSAANPDISRRSIFLSLSTSDVVVLRILGTLLKRMPRGESTIPYRRVKSWFLNDLLYLNDNMHDLVRRNKSDWLIEMAAASIKLDCLLTASQIVKSVRDIDTLEESQMAKYLSVAVEVASAEGCLPEILPLLIGNIGITDQDDALFAAMSHCFRTEGPDDFFTYLPSGRVNRYYVGDNMTKQLFASLLYNKGEEVEDCENRLLLAGFVRKISSNLYVEIWNKHLSRFGLLGIACVDPRKENILDSIQYERAAVAQTSHGLVSVILAVHNAEDTIEYSLNSILNQTYTDIEILICDDASTDASWEAILSMREDPRIRVFRSDINQGPYNVRNALLKEARGQYVTFQDADDLAHPQRIARQIDHLQATGQKAVVSNWVRVRSSGAIVFFRDQNCQHPCLASLLAHRSIFEEFGGFRSVVCGADSEFYEKLRFNTELYIIGVLEQPLVMGLWSSESLTLKRGLEATEDGFRSLARRKYAELTSRQRLMGDGIVTDEDIDTENRSSGIYRSPSTIQSR